MAYILPDILNNIYRKIKKDEKKIKFKKIFPQYNVILEDFYSDNDAIEVLELGCYCKVKDNYLDKKYDKYIHLIYGCIIDSIEELENLPNSITHLTLGSDFNQSIDNLPNSITHLTLGFLFNQPIDNLPHSVTHLTFEYESQFNQSIDNLPNSITHLTFGNKSNFNQHIDNLPNSITHLTLGWYFNQRIDNLPNSITHLKLGQNFNQPIDNLPNSITHLIFDMFSQYNQLINKLPNSLKFLMISNLSYGLKIPQKEGLIIKVY
jgi:hypothetical protein